MVGSSLFVLWGGANDVLNHVNPQSYNGDWFSWSPTKPPPYDFALLVRNAMLDTRAIITGASGGDYGAMLFIDLPDISTVPVARYDSWQTDKTGWVSQTTGYYNQLLRDAVSSWPRTRVLRVNDFIQNWNPQRYSSQFMSGDRGARINACAQRRQSPVRAFWRDAAVAPLSSQSHAQAVCPGACTQQGSSLIRPVPRGFRPGASRAAAPVTGGAHAPIAVQVRTANRPAAPATHLRGARPGQACTPRELKRPVHRPGASLGRPRQRPSSAPPLQPSPSTGPLSRLYVRVALQHV